MQSDFSILKSSESRKEKHYTNTYEAHVHGIQHLRFQAPELPLSGNQLVTISERAPTFKFSSFYGVFQFLTSVA